jgi:hypothetical protein
MRRILLLVLTGITLPIFLPSAARAQVVEVEPGGVVVHRHHHHDWEREREWRERRWRERHRWHRYHHYHHYDHDWD